MDIIGLQFAFYITILLLIMVIVSKNRSLRKLKSQNYQLNRNLHEADEQAKLIIKTDLELNKTQEELDKKVSGLFALQKISHALSTTLEEDEMFNRLSMPLLHDLGFDKCLLFVLNTAREPVCRIVGGFKSEEITSIQGTIFSNMKLINMISDKNTISSLNNDIPEIKKFVLEKLNSEVFVISGLLTKQGLEGILFLGNESKALNITEGEEELVAVLSTQISQAIENARLFEQTWRSQQDLELKVKERTLELTKALENIEKINKRKTDFILAVSHELRTPLTSVKGYASLILAGTLGDVPDEIKTRLGKINEHSDKLTQLIENLMDISRIEAGRIKMNIQTQELKPMLDKIAEMFAIQIKEHNLKLNIQIPQLPIKITADSMQIERVFINLISNAIKFTPEKGKVTISIKDTGEFIEANVSDTGIGIPKDHLPLIFQEFQRANNAIDKNIKGTGLGLCLVKQIVEAHKGRIWFNSIENQGATFSFTIPKAK
ncbi:MAG: GAF domain-containing sensor histidine kinase [Candidatus Gygaella obscura]|nr:GAF domain-containing sensor histidine kinase [Candidatus Gygaella obscura]